jgi:hypothetical protein
MELLRLKAAYIIQLQNYNIILLLHLIDIEINKGRFNIISNSVYNQRKSGIRHPIKDLTFNWYRYLFDEDYIQPETTSSSITFSGLIQCEACDDIVKIDFSGKFQIQSQGLVTIHVNILSMHKHMAEIVFILCFFK